MKVRLTPEEQAMLRGERGEAKRVALEKIVELAEILGAEELVPVTRDYSFTVSQRESWALIPIQQN